VGVGAFGVAYSQDLQSDIWSIYPVPIPKAIAQNVIFNGTNWVACSQTQLFTSSSPGDGWNTVSLGVKNVPVDGVQYFQGTWFAYGPSGLYTSSDNNLAVWTNTLPFLMDTTCNGLAYAEGIYVAYGTGSYSLSYSRDGQSWTQVPLLGTALANQIVNVGFQGGMWVAVGIVISQSNTMVTIPVLATSPDGITWTLHSFPNQSLQMLGVQNGGPGAVTYGMFVNRYNRGPK
jgi:hypothetical protein